MINDRELQARRTLDQEAAEFQRILAELVRVLQYRDRDRVGSRDVTGSGAHALDVLVRLGPIGLNQLAAELFVDKSTVSKLVTGLEEKKYISRSVDPEDRRAVLLEVTPAGRQLHERISGDSVRDATALLRPFTDELRQGMTARLRQIVRTYAVYSGFTDASVCQVGGEDQPIAFGAELRIGGPSDVREALSLLEAVGLSVSEAEEGFPGTFIVAREPANGQLVGLAGIQRHGVVGVLSAVAVHPSFQKHGLGKALLLALVDLAKTLGLREVYLVAGQAGDSLASLGWEDVKGDELAVLLTEVEELRSSAWKAPVMRLRFTESR